MTNRGGKPPAHLRHLNKIVSQDSTEAVVLARVPPAEVTEGYIFLSSMQVHGI